MADGSGSAVLLDPTLTGATAYPFADTAHNNQDVVVGPGTFLVSAGFVPFDGPLHPVVAEIAPGGLWLRPGGGPGGVFSLDFIVGGTLVFGSGVTGPFSGIGPSPFYGPVFSGGDAQLAAFTPGAPWSIELTVLSGTMVLTNMGGFVLVVDGGI